MSLYHEAASALNTGSDPSTGGNLRSRVFNRENLKSPPSQVYALALETCKWSSILSEVIDLSQLLQHEKKLTPVLSLLLVHDFLIAKGGIALPASHGLRAAIERHRSRLTAEFTRARIRRKCPSADALAEQVEASLYANSQHPRWIRINTLKTTLDDQLATTFQGYQKVDNLHKLLSGTGNNIFIDEHIPNLVAVSPRFNFAKCAGYKSGAIILQDKASCFPAYLLDPQSPDGDVIDSCAAPGNKTTHLAAIVKSRSDHVNQQQNVIIAFEKDAKRAKTLEQMVKIAGSDSFTHVHHGQDFLKADPIDQTYSKVGALLLDPSCSGSGIVGRDDMPELHLPTAADAKAAGKPSKKAPLSRKRKRSGSDPVDDSVLVDDDGNTTVITSEEDLKARLEALSSFQLTLLLHAFRFPAARKITYSTCSFHAEENEVVVLKALQSDIAERRGWRILPRDNQVSGMKAWPVRGQVDACGGNNQIAESCIRAYKDDGRGVMGFFVAAFVRDGDADVSSLANTRDWEEGHPVETTKKTKRSHKGDEIVGQPPDDESDWAGFDD